MKEYFIKLYKYNEWANLRVLGAIEKQNVQDEKVLSLFSHLLAAQFLWLHRIKGLPPPDVQLWKTYSVEQIRKMVVDGAAQWNQFIADTGDFNRIMKYKNYVGDYYENNVEHVMMHLVNHGTYHRGQIALLLRQKGFEPINTDFITYDRVITGQWKE
ncbi:MAG: DinB family protein [Bacteroidota bacterium]